jgi:hypothetical protein
MKFEKHKTEARQTFFKLRSEGWFTNPVWIKSPILRHWVVWLQTILKFYEHVECSKCFTTGDYFEGNLLEGPDFTAYVKKARAYTMQFNIAIEDVSIPEEYILDGWTGYDSILPESCFIHWEEEIDDFSWCMLPLKVHVNKKKEIAEFSELLKREGPQTLYLTAGTSKLSHVKASKTFDPSSQKSFYYREVFLENKISEGWYGKRTKIQAFPGGGRDATMASPSTLLKIKFSADIFKKLCDSFKNSAMTGQKLQNQRIAGLWKKGKVFLHWDFKKMGLTCPRAYIMALAGAVAKVYNIDMDWFDFDDLYVQDGKETYKTQRGFALGWMNEAITIVIIKWIKTYQLAHKLEKVFDFMVFNDDVELAFLNDTSVAEINIIKRSLCDFFEKIDVPLSVRKIYASKTSIFLEEYSNHDSTYSFEKRTVAVRLYAKAAMCSYPFMRKSYINVAYKLWSCEDILKELIRRTPKESDYLNEAVIPFSCGGFFDDRMNTLDYGLVNHPRLVSVAIELSRVSVELETEAWKKGYDPKKAESAAAGRMYYSRTTVSGEMELPTDEKADAFSFNLDMDSIEVRLESDNTVNPVYRELFNFLREIETTKPRGVG